MKDFGGIVKKLIFISFAVLFLPTFAFSYDPIYIANNPENMGSIPAIHDGDGFPSSIMSWKSCRVQATESGTATHFIIRVGSNNIGSVPVGFAVYAGTAGERDPIGELLIRGYYPSYNFTSAGYYALPFTSAESLEITSGSYYHIVYLLTPGDEAAASGWRVPNEPYIPPKWFSNCRGADCNADEPPGVGGEYWEEQFWPSSAGWAMGLLDASNGHPEPPTGFGIEPE